MMNAGSYLKSSSQIQIILNLLQIQYSQNIVKEDLIGAVIGFISEQLHLINSTPKGRRYSSSLLLYSVLPIASLLQTNYKRCIDQLVLHYIWISLNGQLLHI